MVGYERKGAIKGSSKDFDLTNLRNGAAISLNGEDCALLGLEKEGVVQIRDSVLNMLNLRCLLDILVKYAVRYVSLELEKTELKF